jgi:6-phospho-3-hexuloisomerase
MPKDRFGRGNRPENTPCPAFLKYRNPDYWLGNFESGRSDCGFPPLFEDSFSHGKELAEMNKIETILKEMQAVLQQVNSKSIEQAVDLLQAGKRIFVAGEGRSGLMGKAFAMRLMHLGFTVYVVGETITPAMETGDVLVAVSGSGTTKSVQLVAQKARELGCPVFAVTTNPESELAKLATHVLQIPAATKYRREGELATVQPLGSLFDQCAHVLFDAICLSYVMRHTVDHQATFSKHSNLE